MQSLNQRLYQRILLSILKIPNIDTKVPPPQLWPALLFASQKMARVYNIMAGIAGGIIPSFAVLTFPISNARVLPTLSEYIWGGVR